MINPSKVRGCFLGTAIGDSLGMPVETFSREKIKQTYGRVTEYLRPDGHKWFSGQEAGTMTDDTQLTLAVAEAMIEGGCSMDSQVKFHIEALRETTAGWGFSTRDSVRRLANGVSWEDSGQHDGRGNGVPMKISPVGLYLANSLCNAGFAGFGAKPTKKPQNEQIESVLGDCEELALNISRMTHRTSVSASAGLAQMMAVSICAAISPDQFNSDYFASLVSKSSVAGEAHFPETIGDDRLSEKLKLLVNYKEYDTNRAIVDFGGGTSYAYHSVPFSYLFFLKNPDSMECIYEVINAGGDTDSNGAIVGALLGALHGEKIFPKHLIDGLKEKDRILDTADRFVDWLNTPKGK